MVTAIYAGTFDPITNGHIDIATRASKLFDKLVVAIFETPSKNLTFTADERVDLARHTLAHLPNAEVTAYSGLTVDFAKKIDAKVIVRGLRMSADFEREFEIALMTKKLDPKLEVICLMTNQKYQFVSSSLLKEIAQLGADISDLVPKGVAEALKKKFSKDVELFGRRRLLED